jgi:hypothetical protein
MPTEIDPIEGNWYMHLDKGQPFVVIAVDKDEGLVEVQHFDGDLEEISLESWYEQDFDIAEEPENWSGALDIGTKDDFGTEVTDTEISDWNEPFKEVK